MDLSLAANLYLRDVIEEDLAILFEHQCDPIANEMAAFSAREHGTFISHWKRIIADKTIVAKAVLIDGRVVGNVLSWKRDDKRFVGYWIGREFWGQGIATESLQSYVHGIADRPLYAYVAKHNYASIRVLEKCGFLFCSSETSLLSPPTDGVEELVYCYGGSPGEYSIVACDE